MMPEKIATAVRVEPDRDSRQEKTETSRWRRPAVQRRTFPGEHGKTYPQWGIRDSHGTWIPFRSRQAALVAAFGEEVA